jgi:hypothetical protein
MEAGNGAPQDISNLVPRRHNQASPCILGGHASGDFDPHVCHSDAGVMYGKMIASNLMPVHRVCRSQTTIARA